MKRILLFTFFIATLNVFAQAPQKMSYQAIIRDASNTLLKNQQVAMQISILQGSVNGTAIYIETQTATTNNNGLVGIEIGTGTSTAGAFSTIDWSVGPYFIKTETDPSGGTSYSISGTSQLMSVPYALYAATSGSSTPGPKGDKGDAGTDGVNGAKGDTGLKGDTGAQGPKGDKGDAGTDGANGTKGDTGLKGDTGTQGLKGDKGDAGTDGANGTKGDTGVKGDTGAQGPKGDKGDTGEKGADSSVAGPKGDKGDTGVKGDSGISGEILTSLDVYGFMNTLYYSIAGKQSTDENRGAIVATRSGTISKLYVLPNKITVAGSSVTVTLRLNGADTVLTATSIEGSAAVFSDLTHSVNISQGDKITFKFQETKGVTSTANYTASVEFK